MGSQKTREPENPRPARTADHPLPEIGSNLQSQCRTIRTRLECCSCPARLSILRPSQNLGPKHGLHFLTFSGAKPGSKATRFRESIISSTLRLVSSRKSPDIGARISWLSANAENKPDLNTWTVITECSSSMGWSGFRQWPEGCGRKEQDNGLARRPTAVQPCLVACRPRSRPFEESNASAPTWNRSGIG